MKVISRISEAKFSKTAIAIGIFDGVHRGHQLLLKKMLRAAQVGHARSLVVTFFPHPAHVLKPDIKLGYLISLEHRLEFFKKLGIDECLVIPFTKTFAHISPSYFIRQTLVKRLGARAIFVGEDFRFGRDRSGDIILFKELSKECGYKLHAVKALKNAGEAISSTRLRRLIAEGNLSKAKALLGYPFSVLGQVVRGDGRGKQLGFPTANVDYTNDIMPPLGVYAVRVLFGKKSFNAVANLGLRPTFKSKKIKPILEVHVFNFKGDLYDKSIAVEFIKKIRDEQKFSDSAELIAQIQKDVRTALKILK